MAQSQAVLVNNRQIVGLIYIRPIIITRVLRALEGAGDEVKIGIGTNTFKAVVPSQNVEVDAVFFESEKGLHIDYHIKKLEDNKDADLRDVFRRIRGEMKNHLMGHRIFVKE